MTSHYVGTTLHVKIDGPVNACIEASMDAILEANLSMFESEQFDWVNNVVSITDDGEKVTFVTCRSIEAWRRGEPNAGRMTLELERKFLQCIYIKGAPVWGTPGN